MTVEMIRVSIGSASVLGLYPKEFKDPPTTCYIMTFKEGHCVANCGFCPQAKESDSKTGKLSRINWPAYPFDEFLNNLKYQSPTKRFKRICLQTLNYKNNFQDLTEIIDRIKEVSNASISVAIPPMPKENLKQLKRLGIERVGIALDGATPEIFENIKGKGVNGPYSWEGHFESLKEALEVFSEGFVSTHIIVGLGETEKEMLSLIEKIKDLQILPGLFAFTPVRGTKLESIGRPDLISFRKIQLSRYLILYKNKVIKDFAFNSRGNMINVTINRADLRNIIEDTNAFQTSGCPSCNRPYYTSRPSGPFYNYPRKLTDEEQEEIYNQLQRFVI